jgi:colanic acid/amylovoran biosynthesis glycosyltransferase
MHQRRLAYLISCYPALSHTFILREINLLKHSGHDISTVSINSCDRHEEALTNEEKEAYQETYYLKKTAFHQIFLSMIKTIICHPIGLISCWLYAIRLAKFDLKKLLYHHFYIIEAILLGQWMKNKRLSHVHIHFANAASTIGLFASKIFPISYSITVHGPDVFDDVTLNAMKDKVTYAQNIYCISNFARSQVMKVSQYTEWHKIDVIPLGVDILQFTPKIKRKQPPYELLCVGRLVPAKGQHILLQAVKELINKGIPIKLRLVGDGPDRKSLEQASKQMHLDDVVHFEGGVNQDRIREFYTSADLFVLASFAEGVPVVLMEAMAMEIPCVTTSIAGIPELIRHQYEGLLVPPSDVKALADAIGFLLEDDQLYTRLAKGGRKRIEKMYNLSHNTQNLADKFQCQL